MDQAIKDALLERLRGYLDGLDADAGGEPPVEATSEAADLFSVFVRLPPRATRCAPNRVW